MATEHHALVREIIDLTQWTSKVRHCQFCTTCRKRLDTCRNWSCLLIAEGLNISRAEMHGIVTFYHDFRHAPAGRHVLKLCRAEACQARGSDRIANTIELALGIKFGETSADRQVTLEAVYCLGLCAAGPSAMIDRRIVGRLTEAKVAALVEEMRA